MFRGLKKVELTVVRRGFDYWGAFDLLQELNLVVRQGDKTELLAISPEARYFVMGRDPEPLTAGLRIGEIGKKQLKIGLEGASLIAAFSDKKKVKVTGQAESLAIYGRDIFGSSISWADDSIGQNDQVIIANKYGEALALGRARMAYEGLFDDRVTVNNEADLGLYIREQDSAFR